MPIYEYNCSVCGATFELRQSFSDPAVSEYADCPNNHQGCNIRRVVSSPAIVFKGSGFYVTDNRSGSKSAAKRKSAAKSTDKEKKQKSTL